MLERARARLMESVVTIDLVIDAAHGQIRLESADSSLVVRGKMAEFLCQLMVQNDWVSANAVHALPGWRTMAMASVGKQISRQIDTLIARGFDVLDWTGKTVSWRLKPQLRSGLTSSTVAAARAWLEDREASIANRFKAVALPEITQWAIHSASAMIAITSGNVGQGYAALKQAYGATDHPDLLAITNVLATRIGQRLETPHSPVPANLGGNLSVFELSVEARRLAAYAIRSDSNDWAAQLLVLQRLLSRLASVGALDTKAYVLNGIALLLRRLGRHVEAVSYMQEAVPLAVFSGDLALIQSIFFNFGNILSDLRRTQPDQMAGVDPLPLLELDIAIRRQFGLGKDSAQAELLIAYLSLEQGQLTQVDRWLAEAQAIIRLSNSLADRALFHRISGLLKLQRAPGAADGLSDLETAISLFEAVGNTASATFVRSEFERALAAPLHTDSRT